MNKIIKIGLIGTGRAGLIHARNFKSRIKNAELIAICDPSEEALESAQKELKCEFQYKDYKELIKNESIDAVVIVTPTDTHKEIAVAAANAGKHLLIEKPLALDVEECKDIINASDKNNVKLQVGFMRRFDKNFMQAKEIIKSGEIGDVTLVKSLTHGPSEPQPWMFDISKSKGPIGEVNSHDLDSVRWLIGSEVESVYAIGGNFRSPEIKEEYPDYYDTVAITLKFKDGKIAIIDGAQYVQYGYDARAEVLGTKGNILIGDQGNHNVEVATSDGMIKKDTMHTWRYLFREAYVSQSESFIDSIINNKETKVTGEDGLKAVQLVELALQSYLENRIVYIDEEVNQ